MKFFKYRSKSIKKRLTSIPRAESTKETRNDTAQIILKGVNATTDDKITTNLSTILPQTQYKNINTKIKDSNSLSPYK